MTAEQEAAKRQEIVSEALSWTGTPFHHEARIKHVGVDCGMLLLEVFERVGLMPHIVPPHYSLDFMFHRGEEWYVKIILEHAEEIYNPKLLLPGDVAVYKHGRSYSHGVIVYHWPVVIHAYALNSKVCKGDMSQPPFDKRKVRYFRHKAFRSDL